MTLSFSVAADIATREACPVPIGMCATCERVGLPILPLRMACAPRPLDTQELPLTPGSDVRALRLRDNQPRLLRRGYLYVMLDRQIWQAYEVGPEGALHQFPAFQVPREEPRPLNERCVRHDHDIPASFLNIDTDKYTTAWLAIANDPWPSDVLDRYKRGGTVDGLNLDERFYKLDLKAARENPASVGIAMTENDLQIYSVLEYGQPMAGDFHSVHGFYPRNHRLRALAGHVRAMTEKHALPNGVLALVLPDPIGMVQELNAQRLFRYQAMQEWCAEPQRRFEHFTSQALLGIREFQASKAATAAADEAREEEKYRRERNEGPLGARIAVPNLDIEAETQRLTPIRQAEAYERLGDRYDEKARADFEASYNKTLAGWQKIVDEAAEPYARHYQGAAFQLAARHDYSATDVRSVELFIRMMSVCLSGGPTERIEDGTLGHSQSLWKNELESRNSLYYQAMHARNKTLLEQLGDDLLQDERTRIYHGLKTFIGTEEGQQLMVAPVQHAIGELLAAGATASNALGKQLSEHACALVGHLHREALLRYSGIEVTQVTIALKVGEYLTLLNEILHEGTERFIAQLDREFRNPIERKVRAMLLSNPFTPALAGNHAALIEIKVWSLESAEALQARLDTLRAGVGDGVGDALRYVRVGTEAFAGTVGDMARHFTVNAEVARLLARDSMHGLLGAGKAAGPGAFNLGLVLGSLWFQQDSLRRSYANLLKAVGDGHAEAVAAVMSASVGVMGATVEGVGMAVQILRPDLTTKVREMGQVRPVGVGVRIVQYGGAVVSLASAVEGVQYALAAGRVGKAGDKTARQAYVGATVLAAGSALAGVSGSLAPAAFALAPLAFAVLAGLAAYGLAMRAKRLESQPMELWARHSRWGLPETHRRWTSSPDMNTAIGALNAALLGLTAEAGMNVRAEQTGGIPIGDAVPAGMFLDYRLVLPGYAADASRYEWTLWAYRPGETPGGIIAAGRTGGTNGPLPAPVAWRLPGYHPETTAPVIRHDAEAKTLEISGAISFFGKLDIHAFELEVSYWPDKSDEAGVARLIVKEDKIDRLWEWGSA
ncbi:T6SS effector BTH_I2691 family protein [Pseudomonas sp. zfem002]|uniref:T6SS effector BTH_I2691 family protein n=1 Tax=Pseudomonas sp. zfem002 TaxID=3078197 RepID=UPI0029276635|nr:T6SS effector BTH_I2691 family protein [Pseudomonas sp. zfem002]MDU9389338.1 T6SS effector BTH_I2691 family protein [Pseudomonas sp. zfem002]